MAARSSFEDPVEQIKRELRPIEKDPRYLQLLKEFKCKCLSIVLTVIDKTQ